MSKLIVFSQRKDAKFKVRYLFEGAPNAFGGFYAGKTFNKIKTESQINESLAGGNTELINHTNHKFS
ncbi:MAG: hypothetical protein DRQ48_01910 [Gammaproteobacteria bacterium]|nr:MAG: hypothetical protein DRQ48_01910 [Gammaproteobacteria bacterium]